MHLFSLASSNRTDAPTQMAKRSESSITDIHPPPDHSVVISIGSHCFSLPQSVTSKSIFQKSKLGAALYSNKASHFDLSDGTTISCTAPGEIHIRRPSKKGTDSVADFALLVDHLLGRKPLETFRFSEIADAYQRLVNEARFWGLNKLQVELPKRLWTRSRWSDLAGIYVLSRNDAEMLKMHPVAIQLEDGTVQGVRVLKKIELENADEATIQDVNSMLYSGSDLQRIVGIFEHMECRVALICSWIGRNSQTLESTEGSLSSPVNLPTDPMTPLASPAALSSCLSYDTSATKMANQILIKLPQTSKVVAYDFGRNEEIGVPNGRDFPLFYRRGDRHVFCFNSSFSLEVQELTDAISGVSKIRCGLSRVGIESRSAPLGSSTTPSPQTSMMSYFKGPGTAAEKKKNWQCYHPQLRAKYAFNMKWIKDFGEVNRIKLFPWGALLVLSKVESPFAILSIDNPEYKKTHGERISICIRGFPHSVLNRADLDITVTPDLERVYLCCCSQIASTSIVPGNNRIEFEIAEQNKKHRLRLVYVDIPEGAPSGASLGSLHCLGMYSEFDPKRGLYYQNMLCRRFCPRYTSAVGAVPGKDKIRRSESVTTDGSETSDDGSIDE